MKIGIFQQDEDGSLQGKIHGFGLGVISVMFAPEKSKKDGKPYYKVMADPLGDTYEIGAAFPKVKDGMTYHSVSIESPALATPLNAALFSDKDNKGTFNLVWNRPEQQGLKAEATVSVNGKPQQTRRFSGQRAMP